MEKTIKEIDKNFEEEKRKSPMSGSKIQFENISRQQRTHTSVNLQHFAAQSQSNIETKTNIQTSLSFIDESKSSIFRVNATDFT